MNKLFTEASEPSVTNFAALRSFAMPPKRRASSRARTTRDVDFGSPTGFRDKRAPAKDVAARSYARRSKNLSVKQQTQLLGRYATLKVDATGIKEGVKDLTHEFGERVVPISLVK